MATVTKVSKQGIEESLTADWEVAVVYAYFGTDCEVVVNLGKQLK